MNALEKIGYKYIDYRNDIYYELHLENAECYIDGYSLLVIDHKYKIVRCFEAYDGIVDTKVRNDLSFEEIKAISEVI